MKNFRILVLAAAIGTSLVACDSLLDLEPQASISDDIALSTPQNVQTALIGTYDAISGGNAYGGHYILLADLLGSTSTEINWNGTFIQPGEVTDKVILTTNSYISGHWATGYNVVNRANNILAALDVFGTDTQTRSRVEAEARLLRGLAFYNMVQVFGKAYNDGNPASNPGIPLIFEPTRVIDASLQVPRNSVAEVYTQVLEDLNAAKTGLPESNDVFADTYVASAFLSRVHLAMGNYAAAAQEANRVIASGAFGLETNFANAFNQSGNGVETVFALQVNVQDGANDMTTFTAPTPIGRADVQVLDGHMAMYEAGDRRSELFTITSRGRMTTKFSVANRNINVIRLAEMYLTRAEANFRLTGNAAGVGGVTPAQDVNMIRSRAGLAPLATVTLDQILKERHLELFLEGNLLLDLKRNQGSISSAAFQGIIPWNDPRLVFPIPQREMLVNAQLVQNEGYQ